MVELILKRKEVTRLIVTLLSLLAQLHHSCNVATCAKGFVASTFDYDDVCELGLFPFLRIAWLEP